MAWTGRSRGGTAGYSIFIFILRCFGINVAYFLLRFVVIYFVLFAPRSTIFTYRYFRNVLGLSIAKTIISTFNNYYLFGMTLLDKMAVYSEINSHFHFYFEGEKHLTEIVDGNIAGILLSAHVGNWEMASQLLKRIDKSVNVVMLDKEYENLKRYLSDIHKNRKFKVIAVNKDFSHMYKILEAINNKELICIHGDRYIKGTKTTKASFFGRDAYFPIGPFALAAATNTPISFVFAMREDNNSYHFYATPFKYFAYSSKENRDKEIAIWVQDYAANLEKIVRKYPSQWFNYYDFWEKP